MHWLKLLKNNLNQQQFKSKHLQASYLEALHAVWNGGSSTSKFRLVGAASCRDVIVAGSHSHKKKTQLIWKLNS